MNNTRFNIDEWYEKNIDTYTSLAANVANTLKTALDKDNIAYVDVPYRVKTKQSLSEKFNRPNKIYSSIEEITDLAGIRVITLVESDLSKVESIIEKLFHIHKQDSGDKNDLLGNDKVGYRSRHYVCDLGNTRESLYELEHLKSKPFEIQTRTALAHAWAEIEHDRCYKLQGKLPGDIDRRLKLVAGLLESADNEFNRLTKEIEVYQNTISNKVKRENLDLHIDSVTLYEYLDKKIGELLLNKSNFFKDTSKFNFILNHLERFEIRKIKDLDNLINRNKIIMNLKFINQITFIGFILCLEDIDKFFNYNDWKVDKITKDKVSLLENKYGEEKINNIIKDKKIYITDDFQG